MGHYLQYGSKGHDVAQVQQALANIGYHLAVDGDFGDNTDAAVRDFQANNSLNADGIVGPDTASALGVYLGGGHSSGYAGDHDGDKEADEYHGADSHHHHGHHGHHGDKQYGAKGHDVAEIQQALANLGYHLDVDGDFGANTDAAVRDFQMNNGLEADGIVGPHTRAALGI